MNMQDLQVLLQLSPNRYKNPTWKFILNKISESLFPGPHRYDEQSFGGSRTGKCQIFPVSPTLGLSVTSFAHELGANLASLA